MVPCTAENVKVVNKENTQYKYVLLLMFVKP